MYLHKEAVTIVQTEHTSPQIVKQLRKKSPTNANKTLIKISIGTGRMAVMLASKGSKADV